ncbi:CoA transferase [Rhodococcus sp. DMU2021]|nr:CaiB/BaiF CoA-transferase family protein [Rhodococcus sp. DMU2021]MBX4171756.1 CoA transferase [Rhodococcus sp. DMU2021]
MVMTSTLPLAGIRVLELGNYIAAPTAGRLLADFGAEVIKVERPGTGDELRNWRLYAGSTSMLFRTINRNKKSIVLDLRTQQGRDDVVALARHCDIVIENFRPGTLERWGIGPEVLNSANPTIIIARISAFGQSGPMSSRPGFAAVAEAYGGLRELVGEPDRAPARTGVSIGDSLAGIYAAFGVMMGLFSRSRTGDSPAPLRDRIVDVALNESVLSVMESLVPDYLAYGVERKRIGGRVEGIAPSNAYMCSDGKSVVIAGNSDAIFYRYMNAIGRPDLADDSNLATNDLRWQRRDELDMAIESWTAQHSRETVLAILSDADVPSGPIATAADIVVDDQYLARDMIQHFPVDVGEEDPKLVGFPGIVPVISDKSLPIRSVGPDLGEHTDYIRTHYIEGGY